MEAKAITRPAKPGNLTVYENDRVTLSYANETFRGHYQVAETGNIDEIKKLLGVPKEVYAKRAAPGLRRLPSSLPTVADLSNEAVAPSAVKAVRAAAKEYVLGDHRQVTQYATVVNAWLAQAKVIIRIAFFQDIVVNNGAVLQVAKDTHALYASSIKMYGTGSIIADGDLTVDCGSFSGYVPTFTVAPGVIATEEVVGVATAKPKRVAQTKGGG